MKRKPINDMSKAEILTLIANSTVNYCERNNVFCEAQVNDESAVISIHGYADSELQTRWQKKVERYTVAVSETEKDNIFTYTVILK